MSELKQTRGKFKLAGVVTGTTRSKFVQNMKFDSGSEKQEASFGVRTSPNNETWVKIDGWLPKTHKATFQRYDNEAKTNIKEEVPWNDRFTFYDEQVAKHPSVKDRLRPAFGVALALVQNTDGKVEYNEYFGWDAVDVIKSNLKDGMQVYVEGIIEYNTYTNKQDEVRTIKNFRANKIRLSSMEIDFESEDFDEKNLFEEEIVFIDIQQDSNDTQRYVVDAYNIGRDDKIASTEFIIENNKLATTLKKNMKPYYAIKVFGRLKNSVIVDEPDATEEVWGDDEAEFTPSYTPVIRECVITKAFPESLDKETYSEDIITSIKSAEEDFGALADEDDDSVWG